MSAARCSKQRSLSPSLHQLIELGIARESGVLFQSSLIVHTHLGTRSVSGLSTVTDNIS
jgi:hypothetical protein